MVALFKRTESHCGVNHSGVRFNRLSRPVGGVYRDLAHEKVRSHIIYTMFSGHSVAHPGLALHSIILAQTADTKSLEMVAFGWELPDILEISSL